LITASRHANIVYTKELITGKEIECQRQLQC